MQSRIVVTIAGCRRMSECSWTSGMRLNCLPVCATGVCTWSQAVSAKSDWRWRRNWCAARGRNWSWRAARLSPHVHTGSNGSIRMTSRIVSVSRSRSCRSWKPRGQRSWWSRRMRQTSSACKPWSPRRKQHSERWTEWSMQQAMWASKRLERFRKLGRRKRHVNSCRKPMAWSYWSNCSRDVN